MKIVGIEIEDYSSFAKSGGVLADIGRTAVIIGRNNAGKSNTLRALRIARDHHAALTNGGIWDPPAGTAHQCTDGQSLGQPTVWLSVALAEMDMAALSELAMRVHPKLAPKFCTLLSPYFKIAISAVPSTDSQYDHLLRVCGNEPIDRIPDIAADFQSSNGNVIKELCRVLRAFCADQLRRQIVYLGGWRNLGEPRSVGKSIVHALRDWKSPPPQQRDLRNRFDAVTRLFRELTGMSDAELVPEPSGENVNVSWRGRYLSLLSMGDGFQHLLIIAFELTVNPTSIFLLEEIETHLHPEVQRRLMKVFHRYDRCQVVMSSHAPAVLDTGAVETVYRAEYDGEKTTLTRCGTRQDLYAVLDQLGVKPSDLLQANVVIWVEGPSDRVLLLDALHRHAPDILEGVHFAFAYYAGKLRSHVGVASERDELIDLLRLGRNVIMICDSDKKNEEATLSRAKKRLRSEVEASGGLYWVTDGREIENYLPDRVVTEVYRELSGDAAVLVVADRFERFAEVVHRALEHAELSGKRWVQHYDRVKVEMMTRFVRRVQPGDQFKLDWDERVGQVVKYIRRKNEI